MTSPKLHCRGLRPFDLTGVGPYFGHPQLPPAPTNISFWGWPLIPRTSVLSDRASKSAVQRVAASARHSPRLLIFSARSGYKRTTRHSAQGRKKTSSCLHNPKHLRRNSLCCYCAFHRKPDFPPSLLFFTSLPCFSCAGLTGYLLLLPQRLNRGERAFCGIGDICIAN